MRLRDELWLDGLETACEDYGQAVIYRGGVAGQPDAFELDGHHFIERGKVFTVCGNTWRMLADTRFAPHFDFVGDFSTHYGIFPGCGTSIPFATTTATATSGSCCCSRKVQRKVKITEHNSVEAGCSGQAGP